MDQSFALLEKESESRALEIKGYGEDCVEDGTYSCLEYYSQCRSRSEHKHHLPNPITQYAYRVYCNTWRSGDTGDPDQSLEPASREIFLKDAPWDTKIAASRPLNYIFGDGDIAALYRVSPAPDWNVELKFNFEDVETALQRDAIDAAKLASYLTSLDTLYANYMLSLKALAAAVDVYKLLPDASVALGVITQPLYRSGWASYDANQRGRRGTRKDEYQPSIQRKRTTAERVSDASLWRCELSSASTFACIAMFESGTINIDPSSLIHVFAMSSGNSIFVAAGLLCDPYECPNNHEIKRVVGNIGRAGIAMMIPPPNPRVREPLPEAWEVINHAKFDGALQDSFQKTSLHLSFTQYTMPINVGEHGGQDTETYFIETLISTHDRDRWVADLDVLEMFQSKLFYRFNPSGPSGRHVDDQIAGECGHQKDQPPPRDLVSIDNWEELLDRECFPVVVRANKNWPGRLATAAVSVKQQNLTVVVPETVYWHCAVDWYETNATFVC